MGVPESGTALAPARLLHPWLLLAFGFAAMYLPLYWNASQTLWRHDEQEHLPIILAIVAWLCWQARKRVVAEAGEPQRPLGWALFIVGLLLYGVGRTFSVSSMAFLSQPLVLAGSLLLLGGAGSLKAVWFPVLYLFFMVPLPASVIDSLTGPLKNWISILVVDVLYAAGYPIARTGVMISIGPYQLLVADACSGLNSMFSLAAVGALFIYFKARPHPLHNVLMAAAILPIAFATNIVRVITLALITFHWGDEAGQGFLHSTTGLLLMPIALGILFALDAALAAAFGHDAPSGSTREPSA